jgi:hypothetical protein
MLLVLLVVVVQSRIARPTGPTVLMAHSVDSTQNIHLEKERVLPVQL